MRDDSAAIASDAGEQPTEADAGRSVRAQRFTIELLAIALAALLLRVLYIVVMRNQLLYSDSLGYHFRAQLFADGHGFVLPFAQVLRTAVRNPPDASVPPGWTLVLAVSTKLGLRSVFSQQLSAAVVGTGTVVATGFAGRCAFNRRVGLIAAALAAVYPNIWLYERELMSETLVMLMVAICILVAYRFWNQPSLGRAIVLGAGIGALALTRAEQALIFPFVAVPLVLGVRRLSVAQRLVWLAACAAATMVVVAPWIVYNTTRFHRPVLISTGFGGALRSGNCDPVYSGDLLGYYSIEAKLGVLGSCSTLEPTYGSSGPEVDDQLRHAAIEYMRQHPSRVPVVAAARLGRTFNLYRPFQQVHLEAERKTQLWVLRAGLFSYWLLLPVAAGGVIVARRGRVPVYPLLAFPLVVIVAVAATIGAVRYRAPAEVSLVILAAVAIEYLLRRLRSRDTTRVSRTGGFTSR